MGIVYKLKKDVIDFILQKKNENRTLSCRQISVLASEKFKIQVSKSSVNTVIKNARLSSWVGRRALEDGGPKKFQIPSIKKKQLSDNLKKFGFELAPSERLESVEKEKVITGRAEDEQKPENEVAIPSVAEVRSRDTSYEKFLECVYRWRETIRNQEGPLLEGMGLVFLKSAEWGFSGASVLGKVLRRYFTDKPSAHVEKSCEMLPYLGMLGVFGREDIGAIENHAIWTLAGGSDRSEICSLLDWTKKTGLSSSILMEYGNEMSQALLNVYRFAVYLEDERCVYMDAQLASLWNDRSPDALYSSLNRSISQLSRFFISNKDSAIFFALGDGCISLEETVEMMGGGESAGTNSIKKIVAFDGKNDPVVEFSAIPTRKRFFSVGVWPWQTYFSGFSKHVYLGGYQPFYFKYLDAIFHVKEIKACVVFDKAEVIENIRVISVLDENKNKPIVVILTNHAQVSAEDVVQAFMLRWPSLDHGPVGNVFRKINFMQHIDNVNVANTANAENEKYDGRVSEGGDISALLCDFGEVLQRRCHNEFFGESRWEFLKSACFHVNGYCMFLDNVRRIILRLPSDHPHLGEIKRAILAVNESATTDFDGHLLLVQWDAKKVQ